uniref:Uncharacterized protein n=1 Tax=Glossina austeni TaxID=7395 RepID=A0A1A9VRZ1_GLOAU
MAASPLGGRDNNKKDIKHIQITVEMFSEFDVLRLLMNLEIMNNSKFDGKSHIGWEARDDQRKTQQFSRCCKLNETINTLSSANDGIVGPGTITSPWTPVSAGPPGPLGPADTNGSMVDSKNLDVGDMSDQHMHAIRRRCEEL